MEFIQNLELFTIVLYLSLIALLWMRGSRYDDKMYNRAINCTVIGIVIITCAVALTSIACR